ncbi:MAG: 4-(cytidine 5'-diphospho)-2-C-methyl-D-erythritol kinase [Candidatus Dasytiphilus stammeri]
MITWPSPAKLNLFLYINGRYPNGYHRLQTLICFLSYCDTITIIPNNLGKITLSSSINDIPIENNLIIRAAKLLYQYAIQKGLLSCNTGANITLIKRLPIGGGLGGGSSNAATTLIALNYLWKTHLSWNDLIRLGLQLGYDVPVFIKGYAAFSDGAAHNLQPVKLPERWYLILDPHITISTALIFQDAELKRNTPIRTLEELYTIPFSNDCELLVRKRYRKVEEVFNWLSKYGSISSRLTGTGSCIFCEFDKKSMADHLLNIASKCNMHGFVAQSLNLSPLHSFYSKIT